MTKQLESTASSKKGDVAPVLPDGTEEVKDADVKPDVALSQKVGQMIDDDKNKAGDVAVSNDKLIKSNVIPDTDVVGADTGDSLATRHASKDKQRPPSTFELMEKEANKINREVDRVDLGFDGNTYPYNIVDPLGFKADISQTAKDMIAAGNDMDAIKKIFDTAAAKFSAENPLAAGDTFAQALNGQLSPGRKEHGLSTWTRSSDTGREGEATVQLCKDTKDGMSVEVSSASHVHSNGASAEEMKVMADRLKEMLPEQAGQLNDDALKQIVESTNDIIKAHRLGADVKPMFDKLGGHLKEENPNLSNADLARLLNYSTSLNPQISTLFFGADKGGVKMIDRVGDSDHKLLASL